MAQRAGKDPAAHALQAACAREPTSAQTDFFTVTRMDTWGVSTWFMCTPEAAEKLIAMNYDNLAVKETTIVG